MATYTKRGKRWKAEVVRKGVRKSKTFDTKSQAMSWASQVESELLAVRRNEIPNKTFFDLLDKYLVEVSANKKGKRWEEIRIEKLKQHPISKINLRDINENDFREYRDSRMKEVSDATVIREFKMISHICSTAVTEWKWLKENHAKAVKMPKAPPPRDRRITQEEIDKLMFSAGYSPEIEVTTIMHRVACAFLFAIETAMRAGEIVKLRPENIDFDKRVATLLDTKNGTDRKVPLSTEAIRILKQLPNHVFDLTSSQLVSNFAKLKKRCNLDDLHFHDTRHEAITRLAKKLDVLPLARMVGHKDLRMLQIYYNETAEEIAKQLD